MSGKGAVCSSMSYSVQRQPTESTYEINEFSSDVLPEQLRSSCEGLGGSNPREPPITSGPDETRRCSAEALRRESAWLTFGSADDVVGLGQLGLQRGIEAVAASKFTVRAPTSSMWGFDELDRRVQSVAFIVIAPKLPPGHHP